MTSFKQMEWLQVLLCGIFGEDVMGRAPANVRFHFAGGGEATSCAGMVGIPRDLGLEGDQCYIWLAMAPTTNSPTLLGLEWIEAAGFIVDTKAGWLELAELDYSVQRHRLPTGHWGLPHDSERMTDSLRARQWSCPGVWCVRTKRVQQRNLIT
jgi:hypothetical protein